MTFDQTIAILDTIGIFIFSLSGGIVAVRARMDLFGAVFMALLPAVGGGTIRDLILDVPVFWLTAPEKIGIAVLGGLTAFFIYNRITAFRPLRWADAFGLALFAATGAAKAAGLGHGLHVVLMMGVVTATIGGLVRDVVANETPLLLKEEIYAGAALVGAGVFWLCLNTIGLSPSASLILSAIAAFCVRAGALIYGWNLPKARLT